MQESNATTPVSDAGKPKNLQTNIQQPEHWKRQVSITENHKKRADVVRLKPKESKIPIPQPSVDLLASLESKNAVLVSDNRAYQTTIRLLEEHVLAQSREIERLETYVLDQAREVEYRTRTLDLVMDQVNRFDSGNNRHEMSILWDEIRRIRRRSRSRSPHKRSRSLPRKSQPSRAHRDYSPSKQAIRQRRRGGRNRHCKRVHRENGCGHWAINGLEVPINAAETQNSRSESDQEEMPRLEYAKTV